MQRSREEVAEELVEGELGLPHCNFFKSNSFHNGPWETGAQKKTHTERGKTAQQSAKEGGRGRRKMRELCKEKQQLNENGKNNARKME